MAHRRRRGRTIRFGKCSVSIRKDFNWGEYVVTTKAPVKKWRGTYHTDDMTDARSTAAATIRQLRRARVC